MDIRTVITIAFYLLIGWYAMFLAGTLQFRRIENLTTAIVLINAGPLNKCNPGKIYERVYEESFPEWCEMVEKSAWFILNKSEIKPIKASIENVKERLGFSPGWVKEFLELETKKYALQKKIDKKRKK